MILQPPHAGSADPISDAILLLGAPRSGTTWFAKIFDSHPDVRYCHEPDEVSPAPPDLTDDDIRPLLRRWSECRAPRTSTKRPFFRKSWQSPAGFVAHTVIATAISAAGRLPDPFRRFSDMPVPQCGDETRARLVIKSVRWCQGAGTFARALPDGRTVLIIRNPCAQIASLLRGAQEGRFELREGGTLPFNQAGARRHAARHGVEPACFDALPVAAQVAWDWAFFNETAVNGLNGLPNTHIVIYRDLITAPEQVARKALAFAGLGWNEQTAGFVKRSTTPGTAADYYSVLRYAADVNEAWRQILSPADQVAIWAVARRTGLARFWPEFACLSA
ncbi:MAG: sulfotransferase [Acetobacteraceae bacterium]